MARTNPPYYEDEDETLAEEVDETNALGGFGSKINGLNPDTEEDDNSILGGGNPFATTEPDYTYDATNPKAWSAGDDFDSALDYLLNPTKEEEQQTIAPTTIAMPGRAEELKGKVDDATAKANTAFQTMQDITKWSMEQDEARAAELKPRFTQEELDSRRAKSTNLSMLTSALANIANGIAVGKGAINATIPDGYQAAYQHWDDVQKKHSARRAEYDKLVDSIYSKKYGMSKAEYDKALKEQGVATSAYEKELDRQTRLEQTRMTNERIASTEAAKLAEDARQFDEKNKAGYFKKQPRSGGGGGGRKSTATSKGLDGYRTISRSEGKVSIPSSMSIEDGYLKMADAALEWLDGEGKNKFAPSERNAIKAAITGNNSFTDDVAVNKKAVEALRKAFGNIPTSVLQNALPQETRTTTTTTTNRNNSGNGGTRSNDSGLF